MSTSATRPTLPKVARPERAPDGLSASQRRFLKLGLQNAQDFIVHLPLRYEDETQIQAVGALRPGQSAQIEGEIVHSEVQFRPRRQLVAMIDDGSGRLALRWLNFYPSQQKQVERGKRVRVRGELRGGFAGLEMVHPRVTAAGGELPDALTPVYPTTDGLSQPVLRRAIDQALKQADLSDTLSDDIRSRYRLMPFRDAIITLHHPPASVSYHELVEREHPAWRRIKFDELLAQQLSLAMARAARMAQRSRPYSGQEQGLIHSLLRTLPFTLTQAQQRVVAEIRADLARNHPMHRLLQGDVGSGKTVVAALAAAQVIANGGQVAMMAPTEILAEQHHRKLTGWLQPLGVTIAWLTGSLGTKARREAIEDIASGRAQLAVGTQALIQDKVVFADLGLAILDEQHRFGVSQRLELSRKGEAPGGALIPHQLNMSATPIPRTLAMTHFADLEVSVIDELPPGRTPVITKLASEERRDEILALVAQEVRSGRQAYWVCPLVEESEALQLQTAVDTHQRLAQALPDLRISLIHGKLKPADKAKVMDEFHAGNVDLLVATTVIEVGVDVPNASLMIIEHAERFGLAQLHQLRGRVGRGAVQSICLLLYQAPLSQIARQRLRAMYETNDGFEIAQRDLEQRGPGEFLGVRQSGAALLRFADIESDGELVVQAQQLARHWLEHEPEKARAHMQRWMRGKQDYLRS